MLEGTTVTITPKYLPNRSGGLIPNTASLQIDTSNIVTCFLFQLFILSGAFVGLDKIISERINSKGVHIYR